MSCQRGFLKKINKISKKSKSKSLQVDTEASGNLSKEQVDTPATVNEPFEDDATEECSQDPVTELRENDAPDENKVMDTQPPDFDNDSLSVDPIKNYRKFGKPVKRDVSVLQLDEEEDDEVDPDQDDILRFRTQISRDTEDTNQSFIFKKLAEGRVLDCCGVLSLS